MVLLHEAMSDQSFRMHVSGIIHCKYLAYRTRRNIGLYTVMHCGFQMCKQVVCLKEN